jgi:membrane protease YdiL (CAAX protease family)
LTTGSGDPEPGAPTGPAPTTPDTGPVDPAAPGPTERPPARPGADTFTIEGRAAPGLFWLGWIAFLLGAGFLGVGLMSGGGSSSIVLSSIGLGLLAVGLVAGAGSQAMERRAAARGVYRGPSPFLVFAAVIPVTFVLQLLLVIPLGLVGVDLTSPAAGLLGLLLTAVVYVVLIRLLVVDVGALTWREMGLRRPARSDLGEVLYGAVLGVPLVLATGFLALVLSLFLALPESPLPSAPDLPGAVLNVVAAALVAPIAEEVFFRGFATTAWLRDIGPRRAIVRGGIFFAAVHILTLGGASFEEGVQMALVAFLIRVPVGLALGWVFVRRDSLYAAIGLHAAYNALPVLLALGAAGSSG